MRSNDWLSRIPAAARLLILSAASLLFTSPVSPAAGAEARPAGGTTAYLPLVFVTPTVFGRMTDHGAGAANVPLSLIFYDGNQRNTIRTFQTDGNGDYRFNDLPAPQQFQFYTVDYNNNTDPSRVRSWETRDISSSGRRDFGVVDLADIAPVSPADGATVSFPVTFQWTGRPWSPKDYYYINLHDPSPGGTALVEHGGVEDHYTINSLPNGFEYGHTYEWTIYIFNIDHGNSLGLSFHNYQVQFTN